MEELMDELIKATEKTTRIKIITEIISMAKARTENGERVLIIKDKDWRALEDKYIFGDKKND